MSGILNTVWELNKHWLLLSLGMGIKLSYINDEKGVGAFQVGFI